MTMNAKRDKTHKPKKNDAWMTIDPRVIPSLLKHVPLSTLDVVWECAYGKGHMAWALREAGFTVYGSDIALYSGGSADEMKNFFDYEIPPKKEIRGIITNPPNTLNIEFARHALELMKTCRGVVCLYQRHEWDATQESAAVFDHPAFAMKIVPRFRPKWVETKRGEKPQSPFHKWSWYIFDWKHQGPPILRFA